ncbi:MAG TPA: hypothetical protein VHJ20_00135 [Polyangia bacterium]|nr:hypothetical protein [Polyangia bacterium]
MALSLSCGSKTPRQGPPAGAAGMGGAIGGAPGGTGGQTTPPGSGGDTSTGGTGGAGGTSSVDDAGAGGTTDAAVDAIADAPTAVGPGCKGALVCYDFESCATPTGWTVPNGEGNQGAGKTLVDNVMPHAGACSLHMKDFSGDQPQHAYLANLPANFGPTLWGSAWVYTTSAPSMHGALVKTRYSIANSKDVDWYEVGYELQHYNGQWHNPLPPSGLPEWILRSGTPIGVNQWQCVEWLFDAGNGGMAQAADPRVWVDGQEVTFGAGIQYDGNNTHTQRPTTPAGNNFVSIEVGLTMYHPIDETTNVYLDDLAFGRERIGCTP